MSDDLPHLAKQYHAFYEVAPYYIAVGERPLGSPGTTGQVQAGFNVDVYGVRTEDNEPAVPPPQEYVVGYAELQKLAERVAQRTTDSCLLEVIPFPSTAFIRDHGQVEAMVRIRISQVGLDQPAGPAEQRALEELEEQLQGLGIAGRNMWPATASQKQVHEESDHV